MQQEVKSRAMKGFAWSGLQTVATQILQFALGIVLARLLLPEDYGVVGILAVFSFVAAIFLDSGFASALIQKKDRTDLDYSTVFYFNLLIACLFYAAMWVSAPYLADFYHIPILKGITRLAMLSVLIGSFNIVQTTKLKIDLNFRVLAVASIVSLVTSGAAGILLARHGFGAWGLAWQGVIATLITTVILWYKSKWHPQLAFSIESFKRLFGFGSKLLCSNVMSAIYQQIYPLVIGRCFSPAHVGYFNRANGYANLPSNTMVSMVLGVSFPVLSRYQDDNNQLLSVYKQMLRMPMFILVPILVGLAALAEPLIEVMIGAKWLPCAPYLQVLCLGSIFTPLSLMNINLLNVKGRSDLVLRLDFIKKPVAFLMLFAMIPFGIMAMCIWRAVYEIFAFMLNCYYTKKILGYGLWRQAGELLPIMLYALVMGVTVRFVAMLFSSPLMKLLVAVPTGIFVYFGVAALSSDESLRKTYCIIKSHLRKGSRDE